MERVKPYDAVLSVQTIADESAAGESQARLCDDIWTCLAGGEWRWDRAVAWGFGRTVCPQWVVVELLAPSQGYGFGFFWGGVGAPPHIVAGGVLAHQVLLPCPVVDNECGSVSAGRCGLVKPSVPIRTMLDRLTDLSRTMGTLDVPAGWSLCTDGLRAQIDAYGLKYDVVSCPKVGGREDN